MQDDQNGVGESVHEPVLLQEVIEGLTRPFWGSSSRKWYLDGTLGGAGHTKAIIKAFGGKVNVIGLDQDPKAIERARGSLQGKLIEDCRLILECENFRNLDKVLEKHDVRKVDMILLDLGISSDELETSGKGFSFRRFLHQFDFLAC